MLSFDAEHTRIVLIGTTQCPNDRVNLPDLPSVARNIEHLAALIGDKELTGLTNETVDVILDPSHSTELLARLSRAAKKATDTLLVYYAGHGIKSSASDGLFIATEETTQ